MYINEINLDKLRSGKVRFRDNDGNEWIIKGNSLFCEEENMDILDLYSLVGILTLEFEEIE